MIDRTKAAMQWLLGDDTGISSRAIFCHFMNMGPDHWGMGHPLDPSDFGRCYRLLRQDFAEGWRERIEEMAAHGGTWAALAKNWSELEALYEQEIKRSDGCAPKLYRLMQRLQGRLPMRERAATTKKRARVTK